LAIASAFLNDYRWHMPIMLEKLYDALRAANVPDDKARAAAVEGASFEAKLASFDLRLSAIEARLNLLQWMVGFNLAISVAIVIRLFAHG
jgi:hypothetical protein